MLEKSFSPAAVEIPLYQAWEASGAFAAQPEGNAQPYTIMIPPPNVTGSLHVGHALTNTIQDVLIRWRRMQGRDALWQPGTDHAGIAAQMVVERQLAAQGISRKDIGRDAFVDRVWNWKAESGGTITRQLRRLGSSLDWERERFTMDSGLSDAVREVFVTLYREGLIYRDRRLVNWDPKFQSAISDLEVEGREIKGNLWYIRYPVEGSDDWITVATTRPETMLGDTAIAVHPDDPRYRGLVGKHAILPLVGRRIPIVADAYSDPEKGSGAVKITPAHDFNDFAVGRRHDLAMLSVLDREARVTLAEIALEAVPGVADPAWTAALEGQDRFAARKAIAAELERLELLVKVEPHTHQVPHGDRSEVPIEPLLTTQWYADAKTLAAPAIEAVETGRTVFLPKQWENTFFAWMRDIQPWCISRQLWWGHRIPAWYGPDGAVFVSHTEADAKAAAAVHYGREEPLVQDEDVLDTWFSSALWPFSTLGWPEQTKDLARYYPGDVLVTGFDIIFFWVARMMMMGLHFMKDVPFHTVYIHGLVRDERGQKMSKSKGNVIDPLAMVDQFGADALRFTICALTGPGRDVKLGPARVEEYRRFVTKLWNAARLCEMNAVRPDPAFDPAAVQGPLARWIMDAANTAVAEATAALEAYRFDEYAAVCYRFTWNNFCDWFLEFAKPSFATDAELRGATAHVLRMLLRLLHPVMPFLSSSLWGEFRFGEAAGLMHEPWPEPMPVPGAAAARMELDWLVRLVGEVRTVRSEMNVAPSILAPLLLRDASAETMARAVRWSEVIGRMARASEVRALSGEAPRNSAQMGLDEAVIVLPLEGLIDLAAERSRLTREKGKAETELKKVEAKLGQPDFIARAKPEVVEENRERLVAFKTEILRLESALKRIA